MSSEKTARYKSLRNKAVLGQKAECAEAHVIDGGLHPDHSGAFEVGLAIDLVLQPPLAAIALYRAVSFPHHNVSKAMEL